MSRFQFYITEHVLCCLSVIVISLLGACNATHDEDVRQPNILFAIADDVSYPHMGAYGVKWVKTPAFDRVAGEGLLFDNAYTPNAKCAPSRAIILTGRNSWQLEEAGNHYPNFPKKFKTFVETLEDNDYHVGFTAKGWAPGRTEGGPRKLTGNNYSKIRLETPTSGISSIDYAANFEAFMQDRQKNEPFFFWYGSLEPHRSYEYGTGTRLGGKKLSEIDKVFGFWPDNDTIRNDVLDYAFEIEHFDTHLGRILKMLENYGELDNTIVIVTADNGMPFPRIKGQAYEYANHLPLAIMWKDGIKNPGRKIADFISFADFVPTILEAVGINQTESGMQPIQGKSIFPLFTNTDYQPFRDHILIGKERHDVGRPDDVGYPIRGIVKGDFLYVKNFKTDRWPAGNPETGYLNCDGSPTKTSILNLNRTGQVEYWKLNFGKRPGEELYNIKEDPECLANLADDNNYFEILSEMNKQLFTELIEQGDPRVLGNGDFFDQAEYMDPSTVNFYNRYLSGEISESDAGWVNATDFEKIDQ